MRSSKFGGDISYSLYIVHLPTVMAIGQALKTKGLADLELKVSGLFVVPLCVMIAYVLLNRTELCLEDRELATSHYGPLPSPLAEQRDRTMVGFAIAPIFVRPVRHALCRRTSVGERESKVHVINVEPLSHGWVMRCDQIDNGMVFCRGRDAEDAAKGLAKSLSEAGDRPKSGFLSVAEF